MPSLPIRQRVRWAAQPPTPALQVVQRVVERHLLHRAGLSAGEGQGRPPRIGWTLPLGRVLAAT